MLLKIGAGPRVIRYLVKLTADIADIDFRASKTSVRQYKHPENFFGGSLILGEAIGQPNLVPHFEVVGNVTLWRLKLLYAAGQFYHLFFEGFDMAAKLQQLIRDV